MSGRRVPASELTEGVGQLITPEFLAGVSSITMDEFRDTSPELLVDIDGVQRLQEEVIDRFPSGDLESDGWLAPRLHCLLRLTRRQASRHGLWRWLALEQMPAYVRHRWSTGGSVKPYRFLGTGNFLRRNAVSRLWWGAEVMRNGADYSEVPPLFGTSAQEQYVLDSAFGHLRPSAIAFSHVAEGKELLRPLKFEETKELAKRVNLLLSATSLESIGPPGHDDIDSADPSWYETEPDVEELIRRPITELVGASDLSCRREDIQEYERWFAELARDLIK